MEPDLDLSVKIAPGLTLANPVMTASGTFGYGTEFAGIFDIQRLGGIVCKGTTRLPRTGNPQPRIAETPCGMLNSIGLQNIGVKALIRDKAPIWAGWRVPVIVNIAGESIEDYVHLARELNGVPGVAGIELNISCPNVSAGGIEFGVDAGLAARLTSAVKAVTTLPVIPKLTPNTGEIVRIARAVADAGADAICLINTLKGMAIDVFRRQPVLGNVSGGLSGPAIKPVALYMVYQVAAAVSVPVIGCGGIGTGVDAIEFVMAGASAVEVGSATFADPCAPLRILNEIEAFMRRHGETSIRDLIGAARR